MERPRPRWYQGWTYLVALAMGWGGVSVWEGRGRGVSAPPVFHGSGRPAAIPLTAKENLATLEELAKMTLEKKAEEEKNTPDFYEGKRRLAAEVLRLRGTLPMTDDMAAVARAAIEKTRGESGWLSDDEGATATGAARFLQWLGSDEEGALDYAEKDQGATGPAYRSDAVRMGLQVWIGGLSHDRRLAVLKAAPEWLQAKLWSGLLSTIASSGEFEEVKWIAGVDASKAVPESSVSSWSLTLAYEWPSGHLGDLLKHATEMGSGELVRAALGSMKSEELCRSLTPLLETEQGRVLLKGNRNYELVCKVYENEGMPLADRLSLIKRMEDGFADDTHEVGQRVVEADWNGIESDGRLDSIMESLGAGRIDAAEAKREILAAVPNSVEVDPKELESRVEKALFAADPVGALALLGDLPPDELRREAMERLNDCNAGASPATFLALQQAVPFDPHLEKIEERRKQWENFAVGRDSDWYRQWVVALPPGLNRDMALEGIAARIDGRDHHAAAALRARISNPEALK